MQIDAKKQEFEELEEFGEFEERTDVEELRTLPSGLRYASN